MILQIFTIHDKKAEAYLPPFYLPQTGMALRTFSDCINDKSHQFSLHPQDYTIMSIGTFDDTTAMAITHPPESLGNGLEFMGKQNDKDQADLDLEDQVGFLPEKKSNEKKSNSEDHIK